MTKLQLRETMLIDQHNCITYFILYSLEIFSLGSIDLGRLQLTMHKIEMKGESIKQ